MSTQTQTREAPRRGRGVTQRRNLGSHTFLVLLVLYFALPLWWLIVASTKNINGLFTGTGGPLWFDSEFDLVANVRQLFTQNGGIYWRWLANSFLYALVGGVGATVLSVLAGYGFAKYRFRGRNLYFSLLLGSVMVPLTALVIPTFVLLSDMGLTNTIWAVILPSLLSPFGVYLARIYAGAAVPDDVIEAARTDGAREWKIFRSIAMPMMAPGLVTVFLFQFVAIWNNYMLPYIMLGNDQLFPITVGLSGLLNQGASQPAMYTYVITGALLSIIPLIALFLTLQRYWQVDLAAGAVKA